MAPDSTEIPVVLKPEIPSYTIIAVWYYVPDYAVILIIYIPSLPPFNTRSFNYTQMSLPLHVICLLTFIAGSLVAVISPSTLIPLPSDLILLTLIPVEALTIGTVISTPTYV